MIDYPNRRDQPPATIELVRVPQYNPFSATMEKVAKGFTTMAQKLNSSEHRPYTTKEDLEAVERAINVKKETAAVAERKNASDLDALEKQAEELRTRIKDESRLEEMECTVSMLPVCSCGHVFKDLEIALPKTTRLYGDSDHEIPDVGAPRFSQIFCPSCNKKLSAYVNRMSFDRCDGIISIRPE